MSNYITSSNLTSTLSNYITSSTLTSTLSNYITSSTLTSTLSNYITSSNLTSILSSFPPFNTPVYNELKGMTSGVNSNNASYNFTNDIWGYSPVVSGSDPTKVRGCLTNHITSGYSSYGWNGSGWFAPYTGKYMIVCTFYITSNFKENIFSLIKYNSSNTNIYTENILANGFNISTYTVNTFTTILPMNQGEYFRIEMSFYSNPCQMYFYDTTYSKMKVMLIG
jgi:hypothetical protein